MHVDRINLAIFQSVVDGYLPQFASLLLGLWQLGQETASGGIVKPCSSFKPYSAVQQCRPTVGQLGYHVCMYAPLSAKQHRVAVIVWRLRGNTTIRLCWIV